MNKDTKDKPAHFNPFKRSLTNDPQDNPIESEEKKSISNDEAGANSNP